MESLYRTSQRRIQHTQTGFHRYLFNQIDWNDRLIAIKGPRGAGKTTLILQHIKESFSDTSKALYVSLDNLWFANNRLSDLVEHHYNHGGTHVFLDEVHKYPDWQTTIKNLYDDFPDLYITYTGSAMLRIDSRQGDLSRRQAVYSLAGMSFREYLDFEGVACIEPVSIARLCSDHVAIARQLTGTIKILPMFESYLKHGYYPFYKEVSSGYRGRLQEVIRQVIESDMPSVEDFEKATILKVKKLLMILAERVPMQPKMAELYRALETNREQGLKMLNCLERGGLISTVSFEPRNLRNLMKPDKILLDNTCLMYALSEHTDTGTIRETFFNNQVRQTAEIQLDRSGDFRVNRDMIFEVGGKNKSFNQIKDLPDSYIAADDIEIGYGNRIPLWMFGLLY